MASFNLLTMDTMSGAQVVLDGQRDRMTDGAQWLTQPLGLTKFGGQTSPVQSLAEVSMLLEMSQEGKFQDDGAQTFERHLPVDQLDLIGDLTAVIHVPSIANQTSTAVTHEGVDGGVATITLSTLTGGIDAFDSLAIQAGFLVADFPNGETRAIELYEPSILSGSGFSGTIERTSATEDVSSFTISITEPGAGYDEGDAITFTWAGGDRLTDRMSANISAAAATAYDGSAVTVTVAAPSSGTTATATTTRVPEAAFLTAAGFDIAITTPGFGYTSAPDVTFSGGGFGNDLTGSSTLTSAATGENLRYIVPGSASGQFQTAFPASASNPTTVTNVGSAILVESDIQQAYANVAKAISGLDFGATATDGSYYNGLDGAGCQDVAAYFTPYAPAMLFEEIKLVVNGYQYVDGCCGEQILQEGLVYTRKPHQPGREAHWSADKRLLKRWSSQPGLKWYVTLPLLTANLKSAYPAAAARSTPLKLVCKLRRWTDLVCNGTGGRFASLESSHEITVSGQVATTVKLEPQAAAVSSFLARTSPADTSAGTAIAYSDFSMQLLVRGWFVSDVARAALQTQPVVVPFVQHFYQSAMEPVDPVVNANVDVVVDVNTAMPVAALHWAGRLKSSELQHQWADFSAPGDPAAATASGPTSRGVLRSPFLKCQVRANKRKELSAMEPAAYFLEPQQQQQHGLCVAPPHVKIHSLHLCAETPTGIQHSSYVDAGTLDTLQLVLRVDPSLFADNSGARGLNGKKSGTGDNGQAVTVTGGQQLTVRYWGHGRNFLIFKNQTVQVHSR
jgi:hypothetical protein